MIKGVFFDAGNTILFPDYEIYREICEALGAEVGLEQIVRAEAEARDAFDRAVASSPRSEVGAFWPVYYTPFYKLLDIPAPAIPDAIEMTRVANDNGLGIWKKPVDGLDDVLDAFAERNLSVGIISNSDGRLAWRLEELGILDRFDVVIDSAVEGVSKPDPLIFQEALKRSFLMPDVAVYVGDYYEVDVRGARGAGMTPVLFDPAGAYPNADCHVIRSFREIVGLVDGLGDGDAEA